MRPGLARRAQACCRTNGSRRHLTGHRSCHSGRQPDPRLLPVGPNPQALVPESGEALAIDDGMKWMVDFDEAERLGMGLRLPLPTATPRRIERCWSSG